MTSRSAQAKRLLMRVADMSRRPLLSNAGYLMGVDLVGAGAGFVFWWLAARLHRPEEVGIATAVISAAALLSSVAALGMGIGLVRFVPEARSPYRLLNTAFTFNTIIAVVASAVFLAGLSLWSPSLVGLQQNVLYSVGLVAFTVAATLDTVVKMAFLAFRQAQYALIHTSVLNASRLLLIFVLVGLGAAGLVGSTAIAYMLAVVLSLAVLLPKVEKSYRPHPVLSWLDLGRIIPYSGGNYVAGLLMQASRRLLPLMILEMLGPAPSAHFSITWMVAGLLTVPGAALASSALAEGSHQPQGLAKMLSKAAALSLLLTVPMAVAVCIAAPWLLLLFGPSYAQQGAELLRWLAAAAPLAGLAGLYFTRLRVQKRIGYLIALSGIVSAVTLGAAAVLTPRMGLAATGAGFLFGNALVVIIGLVSIYRELALGHGSF